MATLRNALTQAIAAITVTVGRVRIIVLLKFNTKETTDYTDSKVRIVRLSFVSFVSFVFRT